MYYDEDEKGNFQYTVLPIGSVFSRALDLDAEDTNNIDNIHGEYT